MAFGSMSAKTTQRLAAGGVAEGGDNPNPALVTLAKSGTSGLHARNCLRSIKAKFSLDDDLIYQLGDSSVVQHIIYPHELFQYMHSHFPNEFKRRLGADPQLLIRFWQQVHSTDFGRELISTHPHLKNRKHFEYTVPLFSHFDAGPQTNKKVCQLQSSDFRCLFIIWDLL
jgi:hypothetical protein